MTDIGWGNLAQYEHYGRVGDIKEDFDIISYEDSKGELYSSFKHASHAMLFARNDTVLWDLYKSRAAIMMQMRFDGLIGFPGGLVDPGENPLDGVNRELEEEIGLDLCKHKLQDSDQVVSFVNKRKNLVLHFYGKEVTVNDFSEIEMKTLSAPDYGNETLGMIRPPLYTMGDRYRGLPAFLSNSYAGNSRQELLIGLQHFKILEQDEIEKAVDSWKTFMKTNRQTCGLTNTDS
ncbi:U8 snoRNA-decapping enzyme-like [Mytilus edulis]|uniref:U8 snoRNA-decapping enzyme-like n=1 Tax=Mytilus edulis TaxID=6550 RepID=UPI0039EEC1FE